MKLTTNKILNPNNYYLSILILFLIALLPEQVIAATPGKKALPTPFQTVTSLTIINGSGQNTVVDTNFTQDFRVVAQNGGSNVSGAMVTFTAPAGDPNTVATAIFTSTSSNTITVTTDANGIAMVPASMIKASRRSSLGAFYNVNVTSGSANTVIQLQNNPGPPAMITVQAGAGQQVQINTALPIGLVALLVDGFNNPVPAISVTFTAPSSGPSGRFPGSSLTATVITDAMGFAMAPTFTTNNVVGVYNVVANKTSGPLAQGANFNLVNLAGAPTQIAVSQGSGQSTIVNTNFGVLLQALVRDAGNNPVANVTVTFTVVNGTGGVSGNFAGQATFTITTDANGFATATVLTANQIAGAFTVRATFIGGPTATFNLTNLPGPAFTIISQQGNGQQATINFNFPQGLIARVTDQFGNPVANGTVVTFTIIAGGGGASGTFTGGVITITRTTTNGNTAALTTTANAMAGSFQVNATAVGVATPATYMLTNLTPTATSLNLAGGSVALQSANVNTVYPIALAVRASDLNGTNLAPPSSVMVTYTIVAGGNGASGTFTGGLTTVIITTGAGGVATAPTITANNIVGTFTVTATVNGLTFTFTLSNTAAAMQIVTVSGSPQTTIVNTNFGAALVARVTDAGGTPQAGVVVVVTAPTSGPRCTFGGASSVNLTTDAQGLITTVIPLAGQTAGGFVVNATIIGTTTFTTFNLNNLPGAPQNITRIQGNGQSAQVGLAFGILFIARVRDQFNNGVPAIPITFTLPATGASGSYPGPSLTFMGVSDANGDVTAPVLTANLIAGTYNVNARATGGNNPQVNFSTTNTPAAPATIAIQAGSGQMTQVNTNFGATLQAIVRDTNNNPVPNATVTFTVPNTGASATFGGGGITETRTTNTSGIATSTTLRANTITGTFNAQAAVGGVVNPAIYTLTNTPGPAVSIVLVSGTPQTTLITTPYGQPLVARVQDSFGNAVPNAQVRFTAPVAGAGGTFPGNSTTVTINTDANGNATSPVLTANGIPGSYSVSGTLVGVGAAVQFNLTNLANPITINITNGSPQTMPILTAFAPLIVRVRDNLNLPVVGAMVTFTAPGTGASGTFVGNLVTVTIPTDFNGFATAPTFTANNMTGTYMVMVSVPTTGAPLTANFMLTNTVGAPNGILATGGGNQMTPILTQFGNPLQATVRDIAGNLLPNITVTFTISNLAGQPGGTFPGNLTTVTAITNAQGVATSPMITANSTSGNHSAMATVAGVGQAATYNLTNLNNVPASMMITNGGTQQTPVTTQFGQPLQVTVLNSVGSPIPNTTVTFTVNTGGNGAAGAIATITVMTNAQGIASTTIIANTIAGSFTVTATAGVTSATFNLTNIPGSPASISLSGNGTQSTQVTTQFGNTLAALVRDQFNNPVPNITVTFTIISATANGATGTFTGGQATTTATTNAQGIATTTNITANQVAGTYNVSATAPNVPGQASYTLTNLAGTPTSITATGNTNQTTKVLTQFGVALQATVVDQFNNPVPNVTVTFTETVGTNGASGSFAGNQNSVTTTTNAQGIATSSIITANGKIGTHNPTAQVQGVATLANYILNNIVGDPAGISASGNTNQTTKVLTQFGQVLQATVVDAANNPVPNVTVTFTETVGTNGASGSFAGNLNSVTAVTDANGIATSSIVTANGKIGTHNPTAQVQGVATLANYILNNIVGDPAGISASGNTNQTTKVLTPFGQVLQATVVDAANNPVPNVTVTFTEAVGTNGASGSFAGNQITVIATTDANGVATSPIVTANGKIGTHNPTAQVQGVATLANYILNNIVGDPAGIIAIGTSAQSTQILTQFTNPLKALVQDLAGNPVPNTTVTFVISTANTGATGNFTGGVSTITLTTGVDGTVTTPLITANSNLGTYPVNATVVGVPAPLTYMLTNLVGNPAGIAIVGLSQQITKVQTPFGNPLQAMVTDLGNNPVPNIPVTFTLPGSQPNGTFPGNTLTAIVATNSAGIATSPIITASSMVGTYPAIGSTPGIQQTLTYQLTNIANSAGSILAVGELEQTTVVTTTFKRALQALVLDNNGNPVNNVPVTFTMSNDRANGIFTSGNIVTVVNTGIDGIATTPLIVANNIVGTFTVSAVVSGVPGTLIYKLNNICSTLTVDPETLPDALIGTAYQTTIKVMDSVNGKVSLKVNSESGTLLPSGMTLDAVTGLISGTPSQSGIFNFTVVATNEFGCSATKDFALAVKNSDCKEVVINPKDLEDGTVGTPYSKELTLLGDTWTAPLIFEIAVGKLPGGLLIDRATGKINGVPTAAGNFTFTVVVKAANGCTGIKVYFIRICAVEHKPIYVADMGNNRIQRSDDGGANWVTIGSFGSGLGQFNSPGGIESNANGTKIFVSDTGNNRVQRSLDSGRTWEVIADFGTEIGKVRSPFGLAYDENQDRLYVADTENSRIQVLNQAGSEKVGTFQIFAGATEGDNIGKMDKPKDVAVTCDGVVYVADTNNSRIQMNATGDRKAWKIFAGATQGRRVGKVRMPVGVFVDGRGVVYVADTANDRVQVNATGSEDGWGVMFDKTEALGAVKSPQGVTVTTQGQVFVTDTANDRLRKRAITGDDTQIGASGEGQFKSPVGIR